MDRVVIGVDPHKKSVTFEARDGREILHATGSFPTDAAGYRLLIRYAAQWPDRIWAVEGANGIGRPLAQRLLAAGERVLDVPAKLAARARVFDTGQGRKTDPADAHAIVMVALRDTGLREVRDVPELTVLRLLCDRRDELSRARAQALNRMHRLFLELVPGGAPVKKSASQYKALLATVRPRDPAGKMRRRMAAEELADIDRIDTRLKAMKAELKDAVVATGSTLMDVHGIGPAGAARILADVGDVARFPDRGHFASWTGTAPIDASSGAHIRRRLSRAGNRRMNHVLYMAGFVQLRNDTPGRRYYRRRLADGKTPMEAMRCLRRRLSDVVYRQLAHDAAARALPEAGPGGHSGASMSSSAADRQMPPECRDRNPIELQVRATLGFPVVSDTPGPPRVRTIDEIYGTAWADEEAFEAELSESLGPRGFDLMFDLVAELDLPPGSVVLDVGAREAYHCIELSRRFGFNTHGIEPVRRHLHNAAGVLDALAAAEPEVAARIRMDEGVAERLGVSEASIDLIWCRDVLEHVEDLDAVFAEFRRVLRPGGTALIYQMTATDWLTRAEAARLWPPIGIHAASVDPQQFEASISGSGLLIRQCIQLHGEWREYAEEDGAGLSSRQLLWVSRLLRDRPAYESRFGTDAYEAMLSNSLWGVYQMIGKLNPRIYVLTR